MAEHNIGAVRPTSSPRSMPTASKAKKRLKHSRKMPYWLWYIIAKSLGIRLAPNERPLLAIILHAVTLFSGGGMVFMQTWFSGYDISSHHTQTDIADGIVAIVMVSLFVSLGVYAQRLSHRLFVHPKFLEMMRLHSKTIAKVNAAVLVVVVMAAFVVVLNLSTINYIYNAIPELEMTNTTNPGSVNPCQTVQIPLAICKTFYASQVIYSLFFLLWNAMVAAVLVCVARTHTISIRKFIRELEFDAFLHDQKLRATIYSKDSVEANDALKIYSWQNDKEHMHVDEAMKLEETGNQDEIDIVDDDNAVTFNTEVHLEFNQANESCTSTGGQEGNGNDEEAESKKRSRRKTFIGFRRLSEGKCDTEEVEDEDYGDSVQPKILSEQELLHKYWKLVASTRLTSSAMQRWMCCVTATVLFWSAVRIVYWLSHTPTLYGVFSLILPLLILPLLASAYAEVNYEGTVVFQSILPTKERTAMFRYLYGTPIQLNVYGYPVSYGTIGTVLAAILAAFASRILIQEMNKVIN